MLEILCAVLFFKLLLVLLINGLILGLGALCFEFIIKKKTLNYLRQLSRYKDKKILYYKYFIHLSMIKGLLKTI